MGKTTFMYGIIGTNQTKVCGEMAPTFKIRFINFLVFGWEKTSRLTVSRFCMMSWKDGCVRNCSKSSLL